MKTPKISIILPCYNVADCMDAMFESLRKQTFKDIEIICVDDKSTDNTVNKIKNFIKQDKRIVLYKLNKNMGVGHARNFGLKKAVGNYVCFFDPDDYIDIDFLEKLHNAITQSKSDVAKANVKVGEKIQGTNKKIRTNKFYFSAQHWSAIYNKKFLLKNNILYPEDVITGQDVVFLSNIVLHADKITIIDDTFYHYVQRDDSLDSKQLSHEKVLSRIKMLDYKIQMMKEHKFNTNDDKNIFIQEQILIHFFYAFNTNLSKSDKQMMFEWIKNNYSVIGDDKFLPYQLKAIKTNNIRLFATPIQKTKIYYKHRRKDGRREIYLFGIKIFSYKKSVKRIKHLNYKTYNDLALDIKSNIHKIPDIDLIVGIPRSGMIPAYILALALNKRVCSLPEFMSGQFGGHGITRKIDDTKPIKNVLIIDDSIDSGKSMIATKKTLGELTRKYKCYFGAVYCSSKMAADMVDVPLVILPQPRVFEWNYLNHNIAQMACYDIDGVLCIDPTEEENDDGEKYKHFILNAKPLYIPKKPIAAIVTSRLEKYRPETEKWLKDNGIEYGELYMLNNMSAEERRKKGVHAAFKAKIYKQLSNTSVFIESDRKQAKKIAELTGKIVFCAGTDEMF